MFLSISSCVTKKQIQAAIWLNNGPLPPQICESNVELKQYGFYRKLDDGRLEFIPYCSEISSRMISMTEEDMNKFLDELPEGSNHMDIKP